MRSSLSLSLVVLMLAGLLGQAPVASAQDEPPAPDGAELFASENMTHVANLPYANPYPELEDTPFGTDIEFADLVSGDDVERLAGPERIATAVAVSGDAFDRAATVLIATAATFPDSLAAAPLAVSLRSPILLTAPDALSELTAEEIARLGATRAIVLGGEEAVGAAVAGDLEALGLTVDRVGGIDRFETAALLADRLATDRLIGDVPFVPREIVIASGQAADPEDGFQSALAAAAFAATHELELLLVSTGRVPQVTADAVAGRDLIIAATEDELDASVLAELTASAATTTTIGGSGAVQTAALLAAASVERGADADNVYVATTSTFPDSLVAGAAVGRTDGVLYLVETAADVPADATADLRRLRIVGGTAAIPAAVADPIISTVQPAETRPYALGGTEYNGMQIIDIADPEVAAIAEVWDCAINQGDIQVFTRGERTFATFTSENTTVVTQADCVLDAVATGDIVFADTVESGVPDSQEPAYGTFVVELTDPLRPRYAGFISVPEGSHNGTVHPSGDYFYNSDSALITDLTPEIQVYDIRDFANIERVGLLELPVRPGLGTSSHDITFNADGTRMYSAALAQTIIFDTTDPSAPVEISSFIDPAINVEHQADPITVTGDDGTTRDLLIVEDELAGAAGNGFCPGGGMHIYDITGDNELMPMANKVGTYFIPEFRPAGTGSGQGESLTCTAHVFRIYPEEQKITIAWYNAGVWVLDISGLADATLPISSPLDMPITTLGYAFFDNSDTWSFKTNAFEEDGSFYGFGNDITRGLDVFRFDASIDPGNLDLPVGVFVGQDAAIRQANLTALMAGFGPGQPALPRCLLDDRPIL